MPMPPSILPMTEWLAAFGALVGTVGMAIAVWLELASTKDVPLQYIAGFFVFGSVLFLLHSRSIGILPETRVPIYVGAGLLIALVAEVYGAVWVYRNTPDLPTATDLEDRMANLAPDRR